MSVGPSSKRSTSIITLSSTSAAANFQPAHVSNSPSKTRELHPLPPIHLDPEDPTPKSLQRDMHAMYESLRMATQPMRSNPASAPCHVRGVQFQNTSPNAQWLTQTFLHALGRPHTGLHCSRAQGAMYQGYEIPNPQGQDPSRYVTIRAFVPQNTTATYDFHLWGD